MCKIRDMAPAKPRHSSGERCKVCGKKYPKFGVKKTLRAETRPKARANRKKIERARKINSNSSSEELNKKVTRPKRRNVKNVTNKTKKAPKTYKKFDSSNNERRLKKVKMQLKRNKPIKPRRTPMDNLAVTLSSIDDVWNSHYMQTYLS